MTIGYLSPISWWRRWLAEGMPEPTNDALFNKHTDFNRCVIDSPNGPLTLTLPVQKFIGKSCDIKDVRISEHGDWRHKHWHALESTYYNSPFFEYYGDDLHKVYAGKQEFLIDFCNELNSVIVSLLELDKVHVACDATKPMGEYYQVFARKHGFIADLSIVDLLCNSGPESLILFNNKV